MPNVPPDAPLGSLERVARCQACERWTGRPQKCSEGAGAFRRQGNGAAQRAEALAYPLTGNQWVAGREMPPRLRGGVVTWSSRGSSDKWPPV
jgi:hypothetical protein